MIKLIEINEKTLYELYWIKGLKQKEIAKIYNRSQNNIFKYMKKYNIRARNKKERFSGKNNPFYGKHHTEESKRKQNESYGDRTGKNNPFYGKHHSDEFKKNIAISTKKFHSGRIRSLETKMKISQARKGMIFSQEHCNNISIGKIGCYHTPESKNKIRSKAVKRWMEDSRFGFQPNYNRYAIKLIEEYGKKHGYNFQHAENGGEYLFKDLGYFVDGYDKEKKIVIEYYEKQHKYTTKRDCERQVEIEKHRDCNKFIIIGEINND